MIIQGSNSPIVLRSDGVDFSAIGNIQAVLYFGGREYKRWDAETAIGTDGYLTLPLAEAETLRMPVGMGTVEVKWYDGTNVKFSTVAPVNVAPRNNKQAFGAGSATSGDGDAVDIVEEPQNEIIIANMDVWMPNVDAEGNISWTRSKSETAPIIQNIKGPKGDKGDPGAQGDKGDKGDPGSDANVTAANVEAALGYAPVKDVQVAGTSVLVDGVANVPIASATKPGVIKVASAQMSGMYIENDGLCYISYATQPEINSRAAQRKTIVCYNLDYAVKAAMCDGKGAAWTSAEQKAARERMGVDKPYELIEEITISEGTRLLERTLEPDGTAYNFREVYVSIITPQAEEDGFIYSRFNGVLVGVAVGSIRSDGPQGGIGYIYAHVANGLLDGYGIGAKNVNTTSDLRKYVSSSNVPSGMSAINRMTLQSTIDIPINSSITIYGVRA